MTPTGQTADGSWEVGVRRTLPLSLDEAWRAALALVEADPKADEPSSLTENVVARFPYRLDEENASTLQLRVLEAASGTTVAFHHEGLASAEEREAMRERWDDALESLGDS